MESSREFPSVAAALKAKQMLALKERLRLRAQATRTPELSALDSADLSDASSATFSAEPIDRPSLSSLDGLPPRGSMDTSGNPAHDSAKRQTKEHADEQAHESDPLLSGFDQWQREQQQLDVSALNRVPSSAPSVSKPHSVSMTKAPQGDSEKGQFSTKSSRTEPLETDPMAFQEKRARLLAARRALHQVPTALPGSDLVARDSQSASTSSDRPSSPVARAPAEMTPPHVANESDEQALRSPVDTTSTARTSLLDRLGVLATPSSPREKERTLHVAEPDAESLLSITRQALAALSTPSEDSSGRRNGIDSPT